MTAVSPSTHKVAYHNRSIDQYTDLYYRWHNLFFKQILPNIYI